MRSPHPDTTLAESREPRLEELGCGHPKTTCHPRQGQGEAPPWSPGPGGLQSPTHSSAPARAAPSSSGWCCQCRVPRWDPLGTWGSSAHPSAGLVGGQGDTSPGAGLTLEVAVIAQVAAHEAVVGLGEQLPTKPPCSPIPGGPRGLHGCPRGGKTLLRCQQGQGNWDAVAERQGGTGRAQSGAGKRARGLRCSGQTQPAGTQRAPRDRDTVHTPNCHRNSNRQRVPNCYNLLDNGQVKNCTSVKIKNKTKNHRPGRGSCAGGGFPALQPRSPVLRQRLEVGVPLCHAAVGTKRGVSAWWSKVTVPTTPGCAPRAGDVQGTKERPLPAEWSRVGRYLISCCCFHSSMRRWAVVSRSSSLELEFSSSSSSRWMLCHFFTSDGIFVFPFLPCARNTRARGEEKGGDGARHADATESTRLPCPSAPSSASPSRAAAALWGREAGASVGAAGEAAARRWRRQAGLLAPAARRPR